MKHIFSTLYKRIAAVAVTMLCGAVIHGARAQAPSNYVQTTTFTSANGSSHYQDVTYYDGLGYGTQSLQVAGSPFGHTLASQTVYDSMHRPDSVTLLPYTRADGSSSQVSAAAARSAQAVWYESNAHGYSDSRPFAEKAYETSRYGRPLSMQREGDAWDAAGGHRARFTYGFNGADDGILRFRFEPAVTSGAGAHPARVSAEEEWPYGSLSLTRTTDESGAVSDSYTDPCGRLVCTRNWTGPAAATGGPGTGAMSETLYAYDFRDSLVLVVQPEGAAALKALSWQNRVITLADDPAYDNNTLYREYCFCFAYDGWGNLTMEHTPGGGTVERTYDVRDRLVLETNDLIKPCRIQTVYDNFDRVIQKNVVDTSLSPVCTLYVAVYHPFSGVSGVLSGFVADAGVVSAPDVETVNVKGLLKSETLYPAAKADGTVPAGGVSRTRDYYYDYCGRVVQVKETDSDGWQHRVSTKYSFAGDVLATKETVVTPAASGSGSGQESSLATFHTRDARGRVLSCSRVLDDTDTLATVHYTYDELGRLVGKTVGDSNNPALETSLAYDLHGWTTGIDVTMDGGSGSPVPVFGEALRYASPVKDPSAGRFDGNIAETAFTHRIGSSTLQTNTWSYAYDGLKRLTGANHYIGGQSVASLTDTEKGLAYDRNGNITALKRYGNAGLANDLSFTHAGNRMTALVDANATGNEAGTKSFTYDVNGNMTADGRKGLEMSWNLLNLADSAAMHGSSLTYAWLSDGTKVAAKADDGSGNGLQKRYVGSFVFTSDSGSSSDPATEVESIAWDEGRITYDGSSLRDCWFAGDHLGNVRTVIDITTDMDAPEILEQSDYLPFGTKIQNSSHAFWTANRWRYAAKEEQRFGALNLSLLDFGARMYDPFTARWISVDKRAQINQSCSPYEYCGLNPVNHYDPNGEVAHIAVGIAVGAIVGAVIEGGIAAYHGKSKSEVLGAMARGAIDGGVIAASVSTGGALSVAGNIAKDALIGAASSAVGNVAEQAISKESVDGSSVAKSALLGVATGVVGGVVGSGLKKASSAIKQTVETKYASATVQGKIRNEIKREVRNEGKTVSGKTINQMEKERVKSRQEASKAIIDFTEGAVDYSSQKNINSISNEYFSF